MSGERQFLADGEDPDARIGVAICREQESRFRQVHLAGDSLHPRRAQALARVEHGERVAFELLRGEHIHLREIALRYYGHMRCLIPLLFFVSSILAAQTAGVMPDWELPD